MIYCVVLEGDQGILKSSALRLLAGGPGDSYFLDTPGLLAMENKARAELLSGRWLVEVAELSGMVKSETEAVKAFLSQNLDQYRPAYALVAVDRPRRCIFAATTNAVKYLPDATGNRRFVPVPCRQIDLGALTAERDQLFAEAEAVLARLARARLRSGELRQGSPLPYNVAMRFALPKKLWGKAAELAEDRRMVEAIEEALPGVVKQMKTTQLPDGRSFITSADLLSRLRGHLGGTIRTNGLAEWMRNLGWSAMKPRLGPDQRRGYAK